MSNKPISQVLSELGPRTVEGDQGRYTAHSITDAIKAAEYEKGQQIANSRPKMRGVLRAMNFRLATHDGRGS